MEEIKNRCANYDKEFECCRIYSDWSEAMPVLQPCIESPCKYFKPYTNYDHIKSMSVEEMAKIICKSENCEKFCVFSKDGKCNAFDTDASICVEGCKQWLLKEVSEK